MTYIIPRDWYSGVITVHAGDDMKHSFDGKFSEQIFDEIFHKSLSITESVFVLKIRRRSRQTYRDSKNV